MISSPCSSAAAGRKTSRPAVRSPPDSKWRSGALQRIYGRRLVEALQADRSSGPAPPVRPLAIKNAANSALALTAQGQTRWSRALLFGRFRRRKVLVKGGGKICRRRPPRPPQKYSPDATPEPHPALKGKKVRDRLRLLSRLVPGCRKLSAPTLLEETADYVAALELQVKTMRALADALSAAALSAPASESSSAVAGGDHAGS